MKFLALALVAAVQAQFSYKVIEGGDCEKRFKACQLDVECAKTLLDYSAAFNRCVENACQLEGLSGYERMKKHQNCDHKCAVNPYDFTLPPVDLQHSCREIEGKGRRADEDADGQFEYAFKQQV
ncbi:MAG: hypothetical protein MHM6MM_009511, partial [Cercozoa sp. M6MM]